MPTAVYKTFLSPTSCQHLSFLIFACVYVSVCVICVYDHLWVWMHIFMYVWRPEEGVSYPALLLSVWFSSEGLSLSLEPCYQAASFNSTPVCAFMCWGKTCAPTAFYISSRNLNSDPQTCIASVFNPSHFSSLLFSLIIASPINVRLYLIAVLISISLKPRETEHSFRYPLTTCVFFF